MSHFFLSAEKQQILDAIARGEHIFVTGSAGTGKTYLLQMIQTLYREKGLHVTASTGIAAVQAGGVTLHSWAGLGIGNLGFTELYQFIASARGSKIRKRLKKAKMLAIDEISMLSAPTFDLLDELLRAFRQSELPFGGVQLILFGDFLQLPPISRQNGIVPFCFEAKAWQEARIKTYLLEEIYRQEDQQFIEILQRLRMGSLTEADIQLLKHYERAPLPTELPQPILLTTHNQLAQQANMRAQQALITESRTYQMNTQGKAEGALFLQKNCLAPESLTLKIGSQVMMLKNLLQEGIVNGSLGIVEQFTRKGYPVVRFHNGPLLPIEPASWHMEVFDEDLEKMVTVATITQVPLALAWAVTIHKSQGMTLDRLYCDITHTFEMGQIYVALSRAKTLEGLHLKGLNPKNIRAHPKAKAFYLNQQKPASINEPLSLNQ